MMKKLTFVLGAAVGYVLGARAGRERYEQIAASARKLWQSEPVQARVEQAGEAVSQGVKQAAPHLGTLTVDGVKQVTKLVQNATQKGGSRRGGADAPVGTVQNPAE